MWSLEAQQGLYTYYLVILKKGSSLLCLILISVLNKHLRRSVRAICFVTIDLSEAYFHIKIFPIQRKFLRFAYQDRAYKHLAIPFKLSLVGRVFSNCVEAALSSLKNSSISVWRVDSPPTDSGTNMGEIWPGSHKALCHRRRLSVHCYIPCQMLMHLWLLMH